MNDYRVVFFDLDHTLWDYEKNSEEALSELYHKYKLSESADVTLDHFLKTFARENHKLWNNFNKGHIGRDEIRQKRFDNILKAIGLANSGISLHMSDEYLMACPQKTNLMPYTLEVLDYLKNRYELFILTNGFDDVQEIKVAKSKISDYFKGMITSESSGHRKPSKEIFDFALELASAKNHECIMIGDNLSTDIAGAMNSEIDAVFFNPNKFTHKAKVNHEIKCLSELMKIL